MASAKNAGSVKIAEKVEFRVAARSVSRGVAIGNIKCLVGNNRHFDRVNIAAKSISTEINKFNAAVRIAKRQLRNLVQDGGNEKGLGIFDVHLLLLDDRSFKQKIETEIAEQQVNAEWAVKTVVESYVARYKTIPDEHFRNRYIDIEDVSDRLLSALGGAKRKKLRLGKNTILAVKELQPSALYELSGHPPLAIISETGGWTSHTFILAREMRIPAVAGLKKLFRRLNDGDRVVVDGYKGMVVLNPTRETVFAYNSTAKLFQSAEESELDVTPGEALKTLDGREINILANSEMPDIYRKAESLGAAGIGLYRSEFLFNKTNGFPTENEQIKAYRKMSKNTGKNRLNIRIFDIGVDNVFEQSKEKNPALGLRAIRFGLTYKKQTKIQLRAILQASFERNIDILVPMVSGLSELFEIRTMLKAERSLLLNKGKDVGNPRIGVMIEIPSAVLMVNELLKEADFICLGTNDLVQYLLAVDRDNENVSSWFKTLHPAVIKAVKSVIEAGHKAGKPAIICGEMAGSPFYLPLLLGLGATDLSMNVNSIPAARKVIAGIAHQECLDLVVRVEKEQTAANIEKVVMTQINEHWKHLFPRDFFAN